MKEWNDEAAKKLLNKWAKEDPVFKERQEFGKMLMRHINTYSEKELKRYNELKEILRNHPFV